MNEIQQAQSALQVMEAGSPDIMDRMQGMSTTRQSLTSADQFEQTLQMMSPFVWLLRRLTLSIRPTFLLPSRRSSLSQSRPSSKRLLHLKFRLSRHQLLMLMMISSATTRIKSMAAITPLSMWPNMKQYPQRFTLQLQAPVTPLGNQSNQSASFLRQPFLRHTPNLCHANQHRHSTAAPQSQDLRRPSPQLPTNQPLQDTNQPQRHQAQTASKT